MGSFMSTTEMLEALEVKLQQMGMMGQWYQRYDISTNAQECKDIIKELKASKQTVGITPKFFPFETNKVQLKKNDIFYLFTDGFPDQFGGERGKKYKYKKFKQFLLNISKDDLKIQQNKMSKEFSEWKRDFEQIDDVCIMGVRI